MHRTIIVNIRLLVGSWPTCWLDQKVVWATALFSNSKHFLYNFYVGHWLAHSWQCITLNCNILIIFISYNIFIVYNALSYINEC